MIINFLIILFFSFWACIYILYYVKKEYVKEEHLSASLIMCFLINCCLILGPTEFMRPTIFIIVFLCYYMGIHLGWKPIYRLINKFYGENSKNEKILNKFVSYNFLIFSSTITVLLILGIVLKSNLALMLIKLIFPIFTLTNIIYAFYFFNSHAKEILINYELKYKDIFLINYMTAAFLVSLYEPIDFIVFIKNYDYYKEWGKIYIDITQNFDYAWLVFIMSIIIIIPKTYDSFIKNKFK
jgi:hypothetical protein